MSASQYIFVAAMGEVMVSGPPSWKVAAALRVLQPTEACNVPPL